MPVVLGCRRTTPSILAPEGKPPTGPSPAEHPVGRALDPARPSVQDVGIDLGCAHVAMTEQLLNRPDVVAILQQVRGERVKVWQLAGLAMLAERHAILTAR